MKRIGKYIGVVTTAWMMLAAGSCTKGLEDARPVSPLDGVTFNADGTMNIPVSLAVPGMTAAATRTLTGEPAYDQLNLYVLVFEQNTEGSSYQLRQLAEFAPDKQQTTPDGVHNGTLVTYTLTLEPTDRETVVHLVATDQPGFVDKIGYGTEESVMSSLYTSYTTSDQPALKDFYGAYWQRVALGCNIPSREQVLETIEGVSNPLFSEEAKKNLGNIEKALSHVPVIRNFCRVSVKNKNEDKFVLTGLYVVNTVDQGSVAPYMADKKAFVDYYGTAADGSYTGEGKNYDEISRQGYIGSLPTGIRLINKLEDFKADEAAGTQRKATSLSEIALSEANQKEVEPVYFYERFARPIDPDQTYAIIRGSYNGEKESYYRIDLGFIREGDMVGIFQYYNLLRNFEYVINLNSVESSGYKSLEEAAHGVVYNNFSASVEARTMNSMSDGEDMIFVNHTSFVFLQPGQEIELLAQFREKITDGVGGKVSNELLKIKWDRGDVISNVSETIVRDPNPNDDNRDYWNSYKVQGTTDPGPTDDLKWQTVYVYRGNKAAEGEPVDYGLYREITFYSHLPWPFLHIDTFPGLWESPDEMPDWNWSNEKREIGQSKGSPLTLFFELPAGIPQALFPMEFVIESDRQNIQNAYAGNAVVRSVPAKESLFMTNKDRGTKPSDWMKNDPKTTRIQYVKTVTWEDYNSDNSMGQVGTGSTIIRCRFLTITDLAQDGVGGTGNASASTTVLRVYNEHFGQFDEVSQSWRMYHEDGFERDNATSDPTPKVWDFSAEDKNGADGLSINGAYVGPDADAGTDGYRDGVTSFSFSHDYPGPDGRTAELFVTTGSKTRLAVTLNGANVTDVDYNGQEPLEVGEGRYLHHVKITIPATVKTTQIAVTAAGSGVKVYKIIYYPRGVEIKTLTWDFSASSNTDGLTIDGSYQSASGCYAGVSGFYFSNVYPAAEAHTAELFVTAGRLAPLTVNVTNGATVNEAYTGGSPVAGESGKYLHQIKIDVPASADAVTVSVTADPPVDIYKIEYYPRGKAE